MGAGRTGKPFGTPYWWGTCGREFKRTWPFLVGFAVTGTIITRTRKILPSCRGMGNE
ncbi:Hypothetical predicted protein [Olea europaea subsp. europaea]|uniref:Uncharacterized protein n=1 Tax=Olea europaea subsp. europaea TaxID=158383 RepID=A0A8S0UWT9_OLEEU|nr:Hypothetical predicted protein [Olea europaea subsp. europaea]